MQIVTAGPADGAVLRELHVATWAATYRDRVPAVWYSEELARHKLRDWAEVVRRQTALGGGITLARCGETIAGFCQRGPTEDDDEHPGQVGHIHRLYVDPARQRTGIGRALLRASTQLLREAGMSSVTLWALETDGGVRAFYERLGWKADGGRKSDPVTDVRYRLSLDS